MTDPTMRSQFNGAISEHAEIHAAAEKLGVDSQPEPSLEPAASSVEAWSANAFRRDASAIVERLGAHLESAIGRECQVMDGWRTPDEMLERVPGGLGEAPMLELAEVVELLLSTSPRQHHPQYLGHQVASALPRAAALALVGATINNGMAAFESGPAPTAMERRVVEWMLGLVGWSSGGGVLTSGGSLGNITALLAARQAKAGFDAKAIGLARNEPLAILVSEQVHYSIERAAQLMGLGRNAVISIPTDDRYRMDPARIEEGLAKCRAEGLRPIAIVASAGATGTGSVDPLNAVADVAEKHDLWLHVDGAHGASALLSPKHASALAGIERADSLVWDAHKLMSLPALVTGVLFKDNRAPYATFAQDASYLFRGDDERWFDIGLRTVECTKPLLAVTLYGCLATMGAAPFREAIEHAYALARAFARMLREAPDFELAVEPDSNIVCFRHLSGDDLDARQRAIITGIRAKGAFYCVQTMLRGRLHLRTSLMNPLTTTADLEAFLEAVRAVP